MTGILHAVESGIGVAALPDYLTADRPHLIRILPETEGPTFDVHLVYCDALRQSKRVAAFRDFLVRTARDWKY
jgi:DNA-binding transcriptional LysR family regulator